MKSSEFGVIIFAIIILTIVISFGFAIDAQWNTVLKCFLYAAVIIVANVLGKKVTATMLDTDVEHNIWAFNRFGWKPHHYLTKPIPVGAILPLFFSVFSLGYFKLMTILSYEARGLKTRVAKRHGWYVYTELTDLHNGWIGAGGIFAVLIVALIAYLSPVGNLEFLAKMASYYAFFNMIPISTLDGTQILFGSRIVWTALALVTLIFTIYSLFIII